MAKSPTMKAIEAAAVHGKPKTNGFVTVACKFEPGIVLQLCREVKFVEEGIGGTRVNRTRYDKEGPTYIVRGPGRPNGQTPKGYKHATVEGGFALTHNIPEDFWNAWLEQNELHPMVKNGLIFASDRDHAEGQAREHEALKSGFQPIVPDNDPRIPRSINAGVKGIETASTKE